MNKLLRTTLLTLLLAVVNGVMAETYTYVFSNKVFSASGTQTLGGMSWTLATDASYFGYDGTKGQQIGSGNSPARSVTLSTSGISGEITEVKVNASTASGGSATLSVSVGGTSFGSETLSATAADYTFTGSSVGEIVISLSQPTTSKALYVKSIAVTYNAIEEQRPCGLAYSEETCTAVIGGQNNTFPTLSNPNSLTGIVYSSSNTVVASVNEKGKVFLNSPGTTVITASYGGNDLYLSGDASYTLTVEAAALPEPTAGAFVRVTNEADLAAGDILLIVNEGANVAMSTTQNTNNRSETGVSITNHTIANPSASVQQVTLEGSVGAWYFNVGNSKYLYAGSNSNNQLLMGTLSQAGDKAKATITISGGNADIKFASVSHNWLRYNSGSKLFSCYGSGQNPVQIYKMTNPTAVVTTAEELGSLEDGSDVRMVIADDADARLLYATDGEAYIRDKTGAFVLLGVEPNVPFASNQHIAGFIFGKKSSDEGMVIFEATDKTNTSFLAIAEPVTEEDVEPIKVDCYNYDNFFADWITVEAERFGDLLFLENRFRLTADDGFADEYYYNGVLADVSAIARPKKTLCPVNINDVPPFTFVIDETQDFFSPSSNLENVRVRLVRTFGDYWNTICLPFNPINPNFYGEIREFDKVEGDKMLFYEVFDMEAGNPYLFRPSEPLTNPVFESVTLSATPAQTIEDGDYAFVGTYSPYVMLLDHTERFLGADDNLHYPESGDNNANKLRGMRAFFRVPAGSNANIDITGSDGITQMETETVADGAWYTLSGLRVSKPQHGVYLRNGKKVVVK